MIDVEALLAPIGDQPPSGPDLEYDPAWQELDRLSQGKPEQQFGDTVIPGEEPDWRDVAAKAEELLGRSKDVRSASLLARSQVRLFQFPGLLPGLQLIHQLLSRYWDSVHPQLDASDNNDPTMRINALTALADPQGLLRDVRAARLFRERAHGDLTVRMVEVALGKSPARTGETVPTQAEVESNVAAVLQQDPELGPLVQGTAAEAKALAKYLDDQVGSDRSPDLKPLIGTLSAIEQMVSRLAASMSPSGGGGDAGAGGGGGGGGGGGNAASGEVRSRQDAILLLDKISDFLARTEPTNPAPLLLQRAKKLMTMNFIELIKELAPDGLNHVRNVTGVKEEES